MAALRLGERIFYHQHLFNSELSPTALGASLRIQLCRPGEKEFFDMLESTLEATPVERLVK